MPWSPEDAPKHDKSADTSQKKRRWAKIANAVRRRTGDDATAIRVASSKVESTESFLERVLSEGEKEPWHQTIRRGIEGLKAIGRAASGEGPRPKFVDNPWANIVHRAATHQAGKPQQPDQSASNEPPRRTKPAELFGGAKAAKGGEDASRALHQVKTATQQALLDRQLRLDAARRLAAPGEARVRIGAAQPGGSPRRGRPGHPPPPPGTPRPR